MEKTRLGLRVSVVGAATYLVFLFGGYAPGLLLAGYILLCETNTRLKTAALTATAATVAVSAVNALVGLIPGSYSILDSLVSIFGANMRSHFLNNLANFFYNVLSVAKTVVFGWLALREALDKPVSLKPIEKLFG